MKSVNLKSKTETQPNGWYRLSVFFKTLETCNQLALPIALSLRKQVEALYFARYTGAVESRLDLIFKRKPVAPLNLLAEGKLHWNRIDGPTPCEGSQIHADAFDFAAKFAAVIVDSNDTTATQALWCDCLHWMHNMVGYDYTSEAKCHLYALDRIVSVFENSIKLGNQMTSAARRVRKSKRGHPHLN